MLHVRWKYITLMLLLLGDLLDRDISFQMESFRKKIWKVLKDCKRKLQDAGLRVGILEKCLKKREGFQNIFKVSKISRF